ncbi:MAG: hypothetical protein E7301_01160 [Butyrivibrio sp.]|nr:hypothetical protein [Butyrivibrio sp.]
MSKRKIIMASVIAALTFICAGCGNLDANTNIAVPVKENLIIVLGNNKYNLAPSYSSVDSDVYKCCQCEGSIAMIQVQSEPELVTGDVIKIPHQTKMISRSKKEAVTRSQVQQITSALSNSFPEKEEADYIKSLSMASRIARSTAIGSGNSDIIILGSGINTTKNLDMTIPDFYSTDPETIVKALRSNMMLPDLSGFTVRWYNLCDLEYEISEKQKAHIKELYTSIIEASGGKVIFETDVSTRHFSVELPEVKRVPELMCDIEMESKTDGAINLEDSASVVFSEEQLGFNPGSTTFIDRDKATETLRLMADFMNSNKETKVLCCGTTADWGDRNYQEILSKDRAETVKKLLVDEYGVSGNTIITIGLSSYSAFYVNDHKEDGSLDPDMAPRNRLIVFVLADSQTGKDILEGRFSRREVISVENM